MPTLKEQYLAMDGASQFLAECVGKEITKFLRELQGISHIVNRCNAEYADCWKAVEELRGMRAELSEANAAIGELQSQVVTLEERLNKAGKVCSELIKERKQ